MRCANHQCNFESPYLRDGSLHLLELHACITGRLEGDEGGFPQHCSNSKYFWLCSECTQAFEIARWTPSGIVLAPKTQSTSTVDQDFPADVSRRYPPTAHWGVPQLKRA